MFTTVRARSWDEVKTALADRPGWVFRGQSRAEWPLETTLYREAARLNLDLLGVDMLRERENHLIEQFQRFAHHYRSDLPSEDDTLAWLALIQHYGGPTRLLDFSYSMYVAAFFAVDSTDSDAALWAMNLSSLELAAYNRLKFFPKGSVSQMQHANATRLFDPTDDAASASAVLHVEPSRLHERIWIQKGLFLAPTDPNRPFMQNLASAFHRKVTAFSAVKPRRWAQPLSARADREFPERGYLSLLKFLLPRHIHGQILGDLDSMNISSATLLPGLEGFARSLRHSIWPNSMWLHEG
jgi:hypothetical protein